jgi:hypothetical protein
VHAHAHARTRTLQVKAAFTEGAVADSQVASTKAGVQASTKRVGVISLFVVCCCVLLCAALRCAVLCCAVLCCAVSLSECQELFCSQIWRLCSNLFKSVQGCYDLAIPALCVWLFFDFC